jgi:hypothetical protein
MEIVMSSRKGLSRIFGVTTKHTSDTGIKRKRMPTCIVYWRTSTIQGTHLSFLETT